MAAVTWKDQLSIFEVVAFTAQRHQPGLQSYAQALHLHPSVRRCRRSAYGFSDG